MQCVSVAAIAQPFIATGSDAEITNDGLYRVSPQVMEGAWVRPDLNLSHYTELLFMPTVVSFRDVTARYNARNTNVEEFPIPDETKEKFRVSFGEIFHDHVAHIEPFDMSDNVGRDVLIVRGLLLDVVSGVPPDIVGRTKAAISRPWEASVVLEIRDSMSDTILARTLNRQQVDGRFDPTDMTRVTQRTLQEWSKLLSSRMSELLELGGGGWARCDVRGQDCGPE
jgi:hypothetical protein